jgi:hypothetical protein
MNPRQFLMTVVQPNAVQFSSNYGDLRQAYNVVFSVDALAAQLFSWAKTHAPTYSDSYANDSQFRFRGALSHRNAEFGLVRDLAKALKHVELIAGKPSVKTASQMALESLGFDAARFDEGRFDGPAQVVVTTNSGEKRVVESVVLNALKFLEQEMVALGL